MCFTQLFGNCLATACLGSLLMAQLSLVGKRGYVVWNQPVKLEKEQQLQQQQKPACGDGFHHHKTVQRVLTRVYSVLTGYPLLRVSNATCPIVSIILPAVPTLSSPSASRDSWQIYEAHTYSTWDAHRQPVTASVSVVSIQETACVGTPSPKITHEHCSRSSSAPSSPQPAQPQFPGLEQFGPWPFRLSKLSKLNGTSISPARKCLGGNGKSEIGT